MSNSAQQTVDEIFELYQQHGHHEYGESVSLYGKKMLPGCVIKLISTWALSH